MRRVSSQLAVVFALSLALPAASQTLFYVGTTGMPGAAGTCAAPLNTIAEALALASAVGGPTELRVAAGTYNEVNLTIDFSDLALKGGYDPTDLGIGCSNAAAEAGRDSAAFVTTVDGQAMDRLFDLLPSFDETDPLNPIFLGSNRNITVDGLVMTNGRPMRPLTGGRVGGAAGAMLILNCDNVVLSNNVFRANRSNNHGFVGGAVYFATYADAIASFNPGTMTLDGNLFENNSTGDGNNGSGSGGAFAARDFNDDGTRIIRGTVVNATNNLFRNNTSSGSINLAPAGLCTPNQDCQPADGTPDTCAVQSIGGGVYLQNVLGTWQGNVFDGNRARPVPSLRFDQTGWGGGLASLSSGAQITGGASPALIENSFLNNTASTGLGDVNDCGWYSGWGGGLFLLQFDNVVEGNFFQGNRAESTLQQRAPFSARGGGLFITAAGTLSSGRLATVTGNTFEGNSAEAGGSWVGGWGGGLHVSDNFGGAGDPVITNNLFTGNRSYTDSSDYRASYGGGLQVSATGNYPLIARNVFENNTAERALGLRGRIVALGGAAHFRIQSEDGVVAENIVRQNSAQPIDDTPPNPNLLGFGGFVFGMTPFDTASDTRGPLVQNNLIVDNTGVGLSVQGLWVDGLDVDDGVAVPEELFLHGPRLVNNTIANNSGVGLVTNLMDDGSVDSNIIWGNDSNGSSFGNWFDNWLCSDGDGTDDCLPRASQIGLVRNNILQDFPAELMDSIIDPVSMLPANGNIIGAPPLFTDATNPDPLLRDYHLQQAPDQGVTSPAVDAGPIGAIGRSYATPRNAAGRDVDGDGDASNDDLFNRTTNSPGGRPDVFFVDAGYHYPLDPSNPVVDTDGDGIPDDVEIFLAMTDPRYACLDPFDADSDDDGVIDGLDVGGDIDNDGTAAACDCDSDGDGLTDGRELNLNSPHADTDLTATCDTSNAPLGCGDPAQPSWSPGTGVRTDPLNPDSDGGGEYDGCEALNFGCPQPTRNPNNPIDDDPDRDCYNSGIEIALLGTDPFDADTDDDGVSDYDETDPPMSDFNFFTDPLICDTDGDGLPDGLERGVSMPVPDPDGPNFPATGTDLTALCVDSDGDGIPDEPSFISADPSNPNFRMTFAAVDTFSMGRVGLGRDSDGDGCLDGEEDANHNGIFEPGLGETDPLDPGDCFSAANLLINGSVTSLLGGTAECGMGTAPPMADILDGSGRCVAIAQPSDYSVNCPSPRVDTATGGGVSLPWTGMETRVGEAEPGAFDGLTGTGIVLVFYEIDTCDQMITVTKFGSDLLIEGF